MLRFAIRRLYSDSSAAEVAASARSVIGTLDRVVNFIFASRDPCKQNPTDWDAG
jgi:hypothetical protein